jgi:hypothetical protein
MGHSTISIAPAAPIVWPIIDLVALMGISESTGPEKGFDHLGLNNVSFPGSERSLRRVRNPPQADRSNPLTI